MNNLESLNQIQHFGKKLLQSSAVTIKGGLVIAATGLLLAACGGGGNSTASGEGSTQNNLTPVSLDLKLPDSLTGGEEGSISAKPGVSVAIAPAKVRRKTGDLPCGFIGHKDDNPFEDGYEMTKFAVSAVAAWSCVADLLIEVADLVPHDGSVVESDNDTAAANYEEDEPTHYRVIDNSNIQTSIFLYYGFDRDTPPTSEDEAGFYLSWTVGPDGTTRGRLIIDTDALVEQRDAEDPIQMRMDFTQDDDGKVHDMYLRFGDDNPWADGLRIQVTKNMQANPSEAVFTAKGLMAMTAQFLPVANVSELPELAVFAVANDFGDGASIAQLNDLSFTLPVNSFRNNFLGDYLVSKEDIYFFDRDQTAAEPWDWIHKTFTVGEFRGNRTTAATDGTWIPFDPSLDMIETALELPAGYFTTGVCVDEGDNCVDMINAVFKEGFADQPSNQGEDPNDWRSLEIQSATYLDTVYPNGVDWTDAFAQDFQP